MLEHNNLDCSSIFCNKLKVSLFAKFQLITKIPCKWIILFFVKKTQNIEMNIAFQLEKSSWVKARYALSKL